MKPFWILPVLLFSLTKVKAQDSWTAQTSGTTQELTSIHCPTTLTCFAVGLQGTLRKTINGGTNWTVQTSGTTRNLRSVNCLSITVCFAAGDSGLILKTLNGGTTWSLQSLGGAGGAYSLYGIKFQDSSKAYVGARANILNVGTDFLFKTTNGGMNWNRQVISSSAHDLQAIQLVDTSIGWAVGATGAIAKTTTGGTSWTTQSSGSTQNFYSVFFLNTTTGYAVGDSGILKSSNGSTWTKYATVYPGLKSIHFPITTTGYSVGMAGRIVKTVNGGTNWTSQTFGTQNFNAVYSPDENTTFIVGTAGTILKKMPGITAIRTDAEVKMKPRHSATPWQQSYFLNEKLFDLQGRELLFNSRPVPSRPAQPGREQ